MHIAWSFFLCYHLNMDILAPRAPMNKERVLEILGDIAYKDWVFYLGESEGRLYLQIQFNEVDADTGIYGLQKGRKWFLSEHMVRQEIVRTAYKAIEAAVLHEMDEQFLFRGKRIYGPHIDPVALTEIADRIEGRP